MPTTYEAIATVTVGSGGAASISFAAIPADFNDLLLVSSARGSYSALGSSLKISFNGSSSNITIRALEGAGGSGVSSFTSTTSQYAGSAVGATATANTFSNGSMYIPNYTSTTNAKSFSIDNVTETNGSEAYADFIAGIWNPATQAAITSLALTPTSGTLDQYSTATLYGIANS